MPTAVGQTKDGRSSYRLGRDKTALSILLSESTMPTAVDQTKYGQSSYRLGCDKAALSIKKAGISQATLNNYFSKLEESDEPIYKNIECNIRKGTSM